MQLGVALRAMRLFHRVDFTYPVLQGAAVAWSLSDLPASMRISVASDGSHLYVYCAQGLMKVCCVCVAPWLSLHVALCNTVFSLMCPFAVRHWFRWNDARLAGA